MQPVSAPVVLLFAATPGISPLEETLATHGLQVVRDPTIEAARALLAMHRGSCVAVLDTTPSAPYSVDAVYRLLHQSTPVPTLLLFQEGDLRIESISATDDYAYVSTPVEDLTLRVHALLRRAGLTIPTVSNALGSGRFQQGRSVVIFGPKGGVGCSTVAVNLAVAFAQLYHRQVALIDADLWSGDLAVLLDIRQPQSISALVDDDEHWDLETLQSVLIRHSSGVHVLRAPTQLTSVERIPDHLPARVVNRCRALFDIVVVDTPSTPSESVLQLFEGADQIVLVTTPELSALRSTLRVLELAPTLGWGDKVLLVLNRANSGVPIKSVEETMRRPVDVSIVSAGPRLVDAANLGRPLLLTDAAGQEQVTRDLGRLAAMIMGEPEPEWAWKLPVWRKAFGRLRGSQDATLVASQSPAMAGGTEG